MVHPSTWCSGRHGLSCRHVDSVDVDIVLLSIPKYTLPLLGLTPTGPGIVGDQKFKYFNADETSNPGMFTEDVAVTNAIPLSARGNVMPTGLFEPMQLAMREAQLPSPYWISQFALKELAIEPLPGAVAVRGTFKNDANAVYYNAAQTSNPAAFSASTCINYVPKIAPGMTTKAILPSAVRNALLQAAVAKGFNSQLWVDKESLTMFGFQAMREPYTCPEEVAVTIGGRDLINGDCLADVDRVNFFEQYRPVTAHGTPIGADWALLAACAFELKLTSDSWVSLKDIDDRRVNVQVVEGGVSVDVTVGKHMVKMVNAQHTTNPRGLLQLKLMATNRRKFSFSQ